MSSPRSSMDVRMLLGCAATAAVLAVVSFRFAPLVLLLLKPLMMMALPALFIGLGMAIAGKGLRLVWLIGNLMFGCLSWFLMSSLKLFFGQLTLVRDFVALLWLILCPIASLVGAWLLSQQREVFK